MNCEKAKDLLLQCEDPRRAARSSRELAQHLKSCGACAALAQKLVRLEQAVWELPVPAEIEMSRTRFLKQMERKPMTEPLHQRTYFARRPAPLWAAAAAILLAAGLGAWLLLRSGQTSREEMELAKNIPAPETWIESDNGPDEDSPELVGRLIAWNLDLTQAGSPADRQRVFEESAEKLRQAMDDEYLAEPDRTLAEKLLDTASLLAENDDPVVDADLFNDVADEILDRLDSAVAREDAPTAKRLGRQLSRVAEHGVNAKLDKAERTALTPDKKNRIEKIDHRNDERAQALASMLPRAPADSHKQIRGAMEASQKHKNKAEQGKKKAGQKDDAKRKDRPK